MKRKTIVAILTAFGGGGVLPAIAAEDDRLQLQLNELKAQQIKLQKQVASLQSSATQGSGLVSVGPVGGGYISSNTQYHRNLYLLKLLKNADNQVPGLVLGGYMRMDANRTDNATGSGGGALSGYASQAVYSSGSSTSNLFIDRAIFSMMGTVNDWIHVESQLNLVRPSSANTTLRTANVLIGNLNQYPVYLTLGKGFLNFGSFETLNPYSDPLTKLYFGPAPLNNATIGFYQETERGAFNLTGTVFRNASTTSSNANQINSSSVAANYSFRLNPGVSASVGAGWISDMGGNNTIYDVSGMASADGGDLSALDLNASLNMGNWRFIAEYNQTLDDVSRSQLSGAENKKVRAYNIEAGYQVQTVPWWVRPINLSLGYGATENLDGTGISAPIKNMMTLGIGSFLDDEERAYLGLEVARLNAYATGGAATNTTSNTESFWVTTLDLTVKF